MRKVTQYSAAIKASVLSKAFAPGPQNLTFDDVKEPKILEFKEQLKAKYPDLKFTSDGPSNSNTKKPKP